MDLLPTIIIVSILGFFIVLTLLCIVWHWRKSRIQYGQGDSYGSYKTPPVRRLTIQGGRVVDVSQALEKAGIDEEKFVEMPYPTLHAFVEPPPSATRSAGSRARSHNEKFDFHKLFPEPASKIPDFTQRVSSGQNRDAFPFTIPSHVFSDRSGSITIPRPSLINIEKRGPSHTTKVIRDKRETYPQQESRVLREDRIRPHSDKPRAGRSPLESPASPLKLGIAHIFPSSGRTSEDNPSPRDFPTPPPPVPRLPKPKSTSSSRSNSYHVQKPPPIPPNPRTSSQSVRKTPPTVPSPKKRSRSAHRPPPLDLHPRSNSQSFQKPPSFESSPKKSIHAVQRKTQANLSPRKSPRSVHKTQGSSVAGQKSKAPAPPRPRHLESNSWAIPQPVQAPAPVVTSSTSKTAPTQRPHTLDLSSESSPPPIPRPLTLDLQSKPRSTSRRPPPPPPRDARSKPTSPSTRRPIPLDLNPDVSTRVRFAPTWEASRKSFLSTSETPISSPSTLEPTSPIVRAPPPSQVDFPQFQTPPPPTPGEIEAELKPEMVARLDRPPSLDVEIPHTSTFSSFFGSSSASERPSADLHRGPSVMSNRSGITIASSEISSNWTIGNAQLVNIYPSVGEPSTSQPQEDRQTPPYAKTLRSKFGRYPKGRRDKALPGLPKSPLSMSFGVDDDDQIREQSQSQSQGQGQGQGQGQDQKGKQKQKEKQDQSG